MSIVTHKFPAVVATLALAGCTGEPPATPLDPPAAAGAALPRLTTGPAGEVWLSWVEPAGSGHALRYARLAGDGWSEPRTVAAGEGWFVNWADFPSLVPLGGERLGAHWLVKRQGGPYAYDVAMAMSRDGGATWSEPVSPHRDGTATEHGFVSLFARADGLGAVWLDGRNTAGTGHEDHDDTMTGAMTLRAGGLDFGGQPLPEAELDGMTCDCCQTGAAAGPAGVVVVYRGRSDEEIRDVYATVRTATGWSEPRLVAEDGWRMAACPVNGPVVDVANGVVAVAWFTAAREEPSVRVAFSIDGGLRFGAPIELAAGDNVGRVDVAVLPDGSAVASWLGTAGDKAAIRYRRAWPDGRLGDAATLATTSAARSAGFPQLARDGGRLAFAWTETGDPGRVRAAAVPIPD